MCEKGFNINDDHDKWAWRYTNQRNRKTKMKNGANDIYKLHTMLMKLQTEVLKCWKSDVIKIDWQ